MRNFFACQLLFGNLALSYLHTNRWDRMFWQKTKRNKKKKKFRRTEMILFGSKKKPFFVPKFKCDFWSQQFILNTQFNLVYFLLIYIFVLNHFQMLAPKKQWQMTKKMVSQRKGKFYKIISVHGRFIVYI